MLGKPITYITHNPNRWNWGTSAFLNVSFFLGDMTVETELHTSYTSNGPMSLAAVGTEVPLCGCGIQHPGLGLWGDLSYHWNVDAMP